MQCLEFRRRVEAEPRNRETDLVAHEAVCAACARSRERLGQIDHLIRDALLIDVPARRAARRLPDVLGRRVPAQIFGAVDWEA